MRNLSLVCVSIALVLSFALVGTSWAGPPVDRVQCGDPTHEPTTTVCGPGVAPRLFNRNLVQPRSFFFVESPGLPFGPTNITDTLFMVDPSCGPIDDINVFVDITHSFVGDVDLDITSPNATTVVLLTDQGTSQDDILTTFDDEGIPFDFLQLASGLNMQTDPTPGDLLSAFDGQDYNGTWVLNVVDDVPTADDGVLNSWGVLVGVTAGLPYGNSGGGAGVVATDGFTVSNTGTIQDVDVGFDITTSFRGDLELSLTHLGVTAVVLDNSGGSNDDVLVTFDDEGVPFDAVALADGLNMQTDPSSGDLLSAFDGLEKNGLWSVSVTDTTSGSGDGCLDSWSLRIEDDTPGLPISALLGPTISSVDLVGIVGPITDVDVLVDIETTWVGDLQVDVFAPSGGVVRLHDEAGGSANDLIMTFDDEGIPNGAPYDAGVDMQPSGPGALSDFDGQGGAGTWTLVVTDTVQADDGELLQWCPQVTTIEPTLPQGFDAVISDTLTMPNYGIIQDLDVGVNLTTTFVGDLTIELASPTGTNVVLMEGEGGTQPALEVIFDDEGIPFNVDDLLCNCPMQLGTLAQSGGSLLSNFDDEEKHGEWEITVSDPIPGSGDVLVNWCLLVDQDDVRVFTFAPGPQIVEGSTPGLPISSTLPPAVDTITSDPLGDGSLLQVCDLDVAVNIVHTFQGDLDVDLTAPSGTMVRLHDQGGSSSDDILLVYDDEGVPNGSQPYNSGVNMQPSGPGQLSDFNGQTANGPWSLTVTDNLGGDVGTLNEWQLLHQGGDPYDGGVIAEVDFSVLDSIEISDVNVGACISSSFQGDMDIALNSPAGTAVQLHSGQGGSLDHFRLIWDDSGLPNGSVPYNAGERMQPGPGVLSDFNGENMLGDWNMTLEDAVNDTGSDFIVQQVTLFLGGRTPICVPVVATDITIMPASGQVPLAVDFSAAVTGTGVIVYDWDFGDGGGSTDPAPSYTYTSPGTYTVVLNVANDCGSDAITGTVVVDCLPLVVGFTASPTMGDAPLTVNFTNTSTGSGPLTYDWDFGDGNSSGAQNPSYTYPDPGTYVVTLTVTDACGDMDFATETIVVEDSGVNFIRGDADGDGSFNGLVDGLRILNFQFSMGTAPPCLESADADGNGSFNGLVDGLFVLGHQFTMGPPPPAPYPACGADPSPGTSLGCDSHPGCP